MGAALDSSLAHSRELTDRLARLQSAIGEAMGDEVNDALLAWAEEATAYLVTLRSHVIELEHATSGTVRR